MQSSQSLLIELVELCGEGASRDRAHFVHSEIQSHKPPRIWTHHGATTREFVLQSFPSFLCYHILLHCFNTTGSNILLSSFFPHMTFILSPGQVMIGLDLLLVR